MFFPNVCSKKVVRAYVVKVSVKQQCCVCVMFGYNNKLFRSFAHFFFSRVRARGATILALWVVKYESAIEWDRHALSWVNVCAIIFLVLWNRYSFTLKWTLTAPYKTRLIVRIWVSFEEEIKIINYIGTIVTYITYGAMNSIFKFENQHESWSKTINTQ